MFGLIQAIKLKYMDIMNDFKELVENTEFIKQLDELFEQEEIDENTLNDSRELIFESLGENIDNLNIYKIKLENKIKECQEVSKRYSDLKKHYDRKLERLNRFLLSIMDAMKTDQLLGNVGYVKRRKNKSVNISDLKNIPEEYLKIETVITPKKQEIKQAIENGIEIPGASIEINNTITYR